MSYLPANDTSPSSSNEPLAAWGGIGIEIAPDAAPTTNRSLTLLGVGGEQ